MILDPFQFNYLMLYKLKATAVSATYYLCMRIHLHWMYQYYRDAYGNGNGYLHSPSTVVSATPSMTNGDAGGTYEGFKYPHLQVRCFVCCVTICACGLSIAKSSLYILFF